MKIKRILAVVLALVLFAGGVPFGTIAHATQAEETASIQPAQQLGEGQDKSSHTDSKDGEQSDAETQEAKDEQGNKGDSKTPAPSKRLFSVIGPKPFPATATYRFYLSEDAQQPVHEQMVKNGDTLLAPEAPASDSSAAFLGWFEKGAEQPFAGFGTVSGITKDQQIKLYARFSKKVLIRYTDASGNVILTQTAQQGDSIQISPDYPQVQGEQATKTHTGWALSPGSSVDVSGTLSVAGQDITLYPIFTQGHWVRFESNGGSVFPDQFIAGDAASKKAVNPGQPIKKGYRFLGWFEDSGATIAYDFDKEVTGQITLYAGYQAEKVQYSVMYYVEKQVSIEPKRPQGGVWEYQLFATEVREGYAGEYAQFDSELLFKAPYRLVKAGYELNTEKTKLTKILEDGSAVYSVYYSPKSFSLTITGLRDENGTDVLLEFTDKYTADLTYMWEYLDDMCDLDVLFDGAHQFQMTNGMRCTAAYGFTEMYHENLTGTWTTREPSNVRYRFFFETLEGQAPEGKQAVPNTSARVRYGSTTDNRTYYLHSEGSFNAGQDFGALYEKDVSECTGFSLFWRGSDGNVLANSSNVRYFIPHKYNNAYGMNNKRGKPYYEYSHAQPYADPALDYEGELVFETDGYMDIYYTRDQHNLTFHENLPEGADQGLLLEDPLLYYEKKLTGFKPQGYLKGQSTVTDKNGRVYVFDGWYTSALFAEQMEFDFNSTMPAYDLDLYAKWTSPAITVRFDTDGGSDVAPIPDVAYGDTVQKPADPVKPGYKFIGWVLNGAPYRFSSPVTKDITLKAVWSSSVAYTVSYDLNGGSGAVPRDSGKYGVGTYLRVLGIQGVTAPAGKVFVGWSRDGGKTFYYPGGMFEMPDENVVLYAIYEQTAKTTTFTYHYNFDSFGIEDSGEGSRAVTQIKNNERVELADFTALRALPEGYAFTGWYLDKACSSGPYSQAQIDGEDEGKNVVYAGWAAKTDTPYTVEFYYQQNGAYDQPMASETRTATTGAQVSVTNADKASEKEHYVLDGSMSGSYAGTVRGDGSLVLKVYFKQQFTIIYDLNGGTLKGSADPVSLTRYWGDQITILDAPEKDGCVFLYWLGSQYHPGEHFTVTEDHTFTAQWREEDAAALWEKIDQSDTQDHTFTAQWREEDAAALWEKIDQSDTPEKQDPEKSDEPGSSSAKQASVKTGDESRLLLWIAVAFISLLGCGVIVLTKKKH